MTAAARPRTPPHKPRSRRAEPQMNVIVMTPRRPLTPPEQWRWKALSVCTDTQADFAEWFGIPGYCARVLSVLFDAGGRPLCAERVAHLADVTAGTVKVSRGKIRDALCADAILGTPGLYSLTESGMAECRRALVEMGKERGAA